MSFERFQQNTVVEELKKNIESCRKELLDILHDLHDMENIIKPRILFIYDSHFGDLEQKLRRKRRKAYSMQRKVELLNSKIAKGEKIDENTIEIIDKIVQKEIDLKSSRPADSNPNYQKDKDEVKEISEEEILDLEKEYYELAATNQENLDLPSMYRRIVKKLHPDLNGETEIYKRFWYSIQDAYKKGNFNRIKLFHKTICPDDNRKKYSNTYSEELKLRNDIRQLKMNISAEKRKIERMKNKEPFILEDKLTDRFWVETRQSSLRNQLFKVDMDIKAYNRQFNMLAANVQNSLNA